MELSHDPFLNTVSPIGWNIGFKDRLKIIIRFHNLVLGQDTASPQDLFFGYQPHPEPLNLSIHSGRISM
jgi:hypothetical protein